MGTSSQPGSALGLPAPEILGAPTGRGLRWAGLPRSPRTAPLLRASPTGPAAGASTRLAPGRDPAPPPEDMPAWQDDARAEHGERSATLRRSPTRLPAIRTPILTITVLRFIGAMARSTGASSVHRRRSRHQSKGPRLSSRARLLRHPNGTQRPPPCRLRQRDAPPPWTVVTRAERHTRCEARDSPSHKDCRQPFHYRLHVGRRLAAYTLIVIIPHGS